ncbi:MAG TPA: hypothetical protein VLA17_11120, partial [Candidatus Limnocylindria bacterium]|nr:hypothetical protein [Candidatus Limnocylindria bacterium]
LILLPFHELLGADGLRWFVPLVLFALLAPLVFSSRRWRQDDPTRMLTGLDKELGLEERAVTAWDLIARSDAGAPAQLVYRQAEDNLRGVEPRTLFPRRGSWPAYSILPLLVLWFALLWSDFDRGLFETRRLAAAPTLARTLRETLKIRRKARGCARAKKWLRSWKRSRRKTSTASPTSNSSKRKWPERRKNSIR